VHLVGVLRLWPWPAAEAGGGRGQGCDAFFFSDWSLVRVLSVVWLGCLCCSLPSWPPWWWFEGQGLASSSLRSGLPGGAVLRWLLASTPSRRTRRMKGTRSQLPQVLCLGVPLLPLPKWCRPRRRCSRREWRSVGFLEEEGERPDRVLRKMQGSFRKVARLVCNFLFPWALM
jgi:hypothetical protein